MNTRLVVALLATLAFAPLPAAAQFRQIPAPTMQEPDPGVDHTAKDADLDPRCAASLCSTARIIRPAPSS